MPPRATRKTKASHVNVLKLDTPPPLKRLKTLSALASPPTYDFRRNTTSPSPSPVHLNLYSNTGQCDTKGKTKAIDEEELIYNDDRLWVDRYDPQTEESKFLLSSMEDLAVHKRKVDDVRRWLTESFDGGKLKKFRRLLVLTGPAGSAKTTTIRVLSRELNFDVIEWKSTLHIFPVSESFGQEHVGHYDYESMIDQFESFLTRAGSYHSLFTPASIPACSQTIGSTIRNTPGSGTRQLILLEDLPNILHPAVRERFHHALRTHVENMREDAAPVVIVLSDTGIRGEGGEERWAEGSNARARGRYDVVDFRAVMPPGLGAAWVIQIAFNPIAPTALTSALKALLAKAGATVPQKMLTAIVDGANGDIRSAVMRLEFACAKTITGESRQRDKMLVTAARRESALALFHLVGKVLYNKRKGDPLPASATKREKLAEQALDTTLKNPKPLPSWIKFEERRTSRVDIDTLYADTSVDASLFGLYIHQNYTQFCEEIDQCDGVVDGLSWLDANGGESWHQTNPYTFHLQTLSTLHALPSPVPRSGQRFGKPEFFDSLKKETQALSVIDTVTDWLVKNRTTSLVCGWSRKSAAIELGGILRILDSNPHMPHIIPSSLFAQGVKCPRDHKVFLELIFDKNPTTLVQDREETPLPLSIDKISKRIVLEEELSRAGELEEDKIELSK